MTLKTRISAALVAASADADVTTYANLAALLDDLQEISTFLDIPDVVEAESFAWEM